MKRFTATIAANARADCTVKIEAESEELAAARLKEIVQSMEDGDTPDEVSSTSFSVEYDTLEGFESLEDLRDEGEIEDEEEVD